MVCEKCKEIIQCIEIAQCSETDEWKINKESHLLELHAEIKRLESKLKKALDWANDEDALDMDDLRKILQEAKE